MIKPRFRVTKSRYRAFLYFAAAFLPPWGAALEHAVSIKQYFVATVAAAGTACITLRAYADQTPSQDGKDPEPTVHN